jgi:hypothetical protein
MKKEGGNTQAPKAPGCLEPIKSRRGSYRLSGDYFNHLLNEIK